MKKRILSIFISLVIVSVLGFQYGPELMSRFNTAYAVGDLIVDWGTAGTGNVGPVFTTANMVPGMSQSHQVTISNGSAESRPVGIRGSKNTETGNLASVMDIVISRDGTPVYGTGSPTGNKTMANFFSESVLPNFISLGTLAPSENEIYTIVITFLPAAGNEFQNRTLEFNLIFGIAIDVPVACNTLGINNVVYGSSGNDRLNGTNKNDLLVSFEGNDTVNGGNGNDCIVDLSGNGTLTGGNGIDVITAGSGNTTIDGGNGRDIVFAGPGNDVIKGGNDIDTLNGEAGNDRIEGDNDNDMLSGGDGDDQLIGGMGNDQIDGQGGVDTANGNLGTDMCVAEAKLACEL